MNMFIAGVGNVELFKGNSKVLVSKTLVDSSINLSVSLEDIRAGQGAKLYGKYVNDSNLTIKLTDAMFNLDFLAANIGDNIISGGSAVDTVTKVVQALDTNDINSTKIDISDIVPLPLYQGTNKIYIWCAKSGTDDFVLFDVTNESGLATDEVVVTNFFEKDDILCVRYIKPYDVGDTLVISANFIPDTLTAVITAPLFTGDGGALKTSTKVGTLTITIPRFMLNGTTDLSMTMTGVTQMALEGSALAVEDDECDEGTYYAIISQVITNQKITDGLIRIGIEPPETYQELIAQPLQVFGYYSGVGSKIIPAKAINIEYFGTERTVSYNKTTGLISIDNIIDNPTEDFIIRITVGDIVGYKNSVFLSADTTLENFNVGNLIKGQFVDGNYSIDVAGVMTLSTDEENKMLSTYPSFLSNDMINKVIIQDFYEIGATAFAGCGSLINVVLSNDVVFVGNRAFENCYNLTSISLPDSITTIGRAAFYETAYYNDTTNWDNDVLYIDNCLIGAKDTISGNYIIMEDTKVISDSAFYNCKSLTSIAIPDGVTSIGDCAFLSCYNLTSVNIPDGVTRIGEDAFYYCVSLTNVIIPNSVTSIGKNAFGYCIGLTSITIPDSVEIIGEWAFAHCWNLTSVTIGNGVTSIGNTAFYNCKSLTSVNIPDGVTSIGDRAFENCYVIEKYYVYAITPPILSQRSLSGTTDFKIYVPSVAVDSYKQATNWSYYASRIFAIEE